MDEPYSALPHQDWILDALEGGEYQLINQWSGLAVDTQSGATSAGTAIVQQTPSGTATQRWAITYSTGFPKKGAGGTTFATPLRSAWVYNWGLTTSAHLIPGTIFNPMQWGSYNWDIGSNAGPLWQHYPTWRRDSGSLHLLGFNEPDEFSQSGQSLDPNNPQNESQFSATRSMQEAVRLWPRLQSLDLPLVSPVPVNVSNGWLASFYTQAANLGYRVDVTAVHTYPGPSNGSSNALISPVQTAYNNWGRPVWLTEFSFVDWGGNSAWSEEDTYNCLAEFLWRAESISWLRKYALFAFTEDASNPQPANPWQDFTPAPRSNTYDINGKLTPFGKLYAGWDQDAAVRTDKIYYIHNKDTRKRLANTLAAGPNGRSIRVDDGSVYWTLAATGTAGRYYIVSTRDGRRLSYVNGGSVTFAPAGTTGSAVEWSLTENEYGWFYVNHPATSRRLQLAYNNSTSVATYTMATGSSTGAALEWRFIVPPPSSVWDGSASSDWNTGDNWVSGGIPKSGDTVTFNSSSTANLSTTLNQDFEVNGIVVENPAANVTIGGSFTLKIGNSGIDLSDSTRNLTISAPITLDSPQKWDIAAGRSLTISGALVGTSAVTIGGSGSVTLGTVLDPQMPLTIEAPSTLRMSANNLLPNGASALSPVFAGTLDLNGTAQSLNTLTSGTVDNTSASAATLTLGAGDTSFTLATLLKNTNGSLALVKTGSGSITLPGANTHSGGFANHGSGFIYPQNSASFGSGPVAMNASTIYCVSTAYTFTNALTLNAATLRVGGGSGRSVDWAGPVSITANSGLSSDAGTSGITISGSLNIAGVAFTSFGNSVTNTISGSISGSGSISVTGGTLILSAANTFTGSYRSVAGTLRARHVAALQNATLDMNSADAGSVSFNNLSATLGALTGTRNLALGSDAGQPVARANYSAYGILIGSNGTLNTRSNGREPSASKPTPTASTTWVHYKYRYMGRFLSEDPIGLCGGQGIE